MARRHLKIIVLLTFVFLCFPHNVLGASSQGNKMADIGAKLACGTSRIYAYQSSTRIYNDIRNLIKDTDVKTIFVTGRKALQLYDKYCYNDVLIKAIYLPSTSGANASFGYDKLKEKYMIIVKCLKNNSKKEEK